MGSRHGNDECEDIIYEGVESLLTDTQAETKPSVIEG